MLFRFHQCALAVVSALLVTMAQAGDEPGGHGFQSPSGNIHCWLDDLGEASGRYPAALRCDILRTDGPPPPRPASCAFDWGGAFGLSHAANAAAERLCVSDSVADPRRPVLRYGEAWSMAGFACTSAASGITCTNAAGRGFALSRASQRLF